MMKRMVCVLLAVGCASLLGRAQAPQNPPGESARPADPAAPAPPARPAGAADPVVGNWRGTMTSAAGVESPIIITIAKKGDGYAGSTNGFNASSESALKRLAISGTRVSLEAADDSKLGAVSLAADLAAEGNTLKGAGVVSIGAQKFDVSLALQRRPRAEAIQPHVEQ